MFEDHLSRRNFLKASGAVGGALPWALNLAAIGDVAAAGITKDYKALVCVFMFGGNDHANTIIPRDWTNYNRYANIRKNVKIERHKIQRLYSAGGAEGVELGFHPQLKNLRNIFHANDLAVQLNVGTLFGPTTLNQFKNKSVPLPPRLFSHNDQQSIWQSSKPEGSTKGWGGAITEATRSSYGKSTFNTVSVHGSAVFLAGDDVHQYQCTPDGAIPIQSYQKYPLFGSKEVSRAFNKLVDQKNHHLFKQELYNVTQRSINAYEQLAPVRDAQVGNFFDPNNRLSQQLKYVAKMIKANKELGVKRQVFFVGVGGYDNHSQLLVNHERKMQELDVGLASFYSAIKEMNMNNQVTTFTASDFGRALAPNLDGTDHGWGSHHFIMGGAVRGRRFYGEMPEIALNTKDDVGKGRLLPTTSVDQYATTMASWFGVSASDMPLIAPNINNFNNKYLGFL